MVPPLHTTVQLPFWQDCPEEHLLPQEPQLFGSLESVTHWPPQLVLPPPHTTVQFELTQLWPALHLVEQLPQWLGSTLVSTH